jgi:hypothetical protein
MTRVKFILTHPAYTGTYIFSKTQADPGARAAGQSKRIKLPQDHWIKIVDHHPRYMTLEEQEEIKSILRKNQFKRRARVARSRAAIQGLLRCGRCSSSLLVQYPSRKVVTFTCKRLRDYAERACLRFGSNELDGWILGEVFKLLKAPPVEMLRSALEGSRKTNRTRLRRIESERKRLIDEESIARERAELTRRSLPSVHLEALQQLENVLQRKLQFEQTTATRPTEAVPDVAETEMKELCRIAVDLPTLWRHQAVTDRERTAILRCLVDHIVVDLTKHKILATIVWKSGAQTSVSFWRARSRHYLLSELHAQHLTTAEIRERLAAGKTSTGQVVNMGLAGIQKSLWKMGLKAAKYSADDLLVRRTAAELDREGQSLDAIARYFNEQGFVSPSGKPWTHFMIEHLLHANGRKQESLENIHGRAITEARARGLSYQQMAAEFNEKTIRRRGGLRWTAKSVEIRWSDLKRMQAKREQNESTEPLFLKRKA